MNASGQRDWINDTADEVIKSAEAADQPLITCASGISPSGPIHLGNLREIMVPHLVAEEIKRRGVPCRHILSWDDFDRLRKIPAGAPSSFAEHIGRPLTGVPDPGGCHASWADHFKDPFRKALDAMGIEIAEISQKLQYTSGAYAQQITTAIGARRQIQAILAQHQTKAAEAPAETSAGADYFPYKPYCHDCGRDTTTIDRYDRDRTTAQYICACGNEGSIDVAAASRGKLVWKVDWPMRWAYESVNFEAAGTDHSSPGSSFTVGKQIVGAVFGGTSPNYLAYSFVGASGGSAKLSGSAGAAPTPADALQILEPQILRWLYARRKPNQSITVAFDQEVLRLYDEWDNLSKRVAEGDAGPAELLSWQRSAQPSTGQLSAVAVRLPFRTLSSIADVTAGDPTQILRILSDLSAASVQAVSNVEPRLTLACNWITDYVAEDQRTTVRSEPSIELLAGLTSHQSEAIKHLVSDLDANWSLERLTALVYGIPKVQLGLPMDTKPTEELKVAQREFFILLYRLLVDADTGPRLPTLLLAIGIDKLRALLRPVS